MSSNFSSSSFVIGAICGVFLAGAWFSSGAFPLSKKPLPEVRTGGALTDIEESKVISVPNQPAGDTVVVGSVTVPAPGVWVAVREMNGRDFGNVLGAVRLSEPRESFTIPLLRATEPKRSYAIELYRNDNNGEYDPGHNSVYVDFETGKRVVAFFTTE